MRCYALRLLIDTPALQDLVPIAASLLPCNLQTGRRLLQAAAAIRLAVTSAATTS